MEENNNEVYRTSKSKFQEVRPENEEVMMNYLIKELIKPNSLYSNNTSNTFNINNSVLNKMPYNLFGLIISTFESQNETKVEYGCGMLIDSNIILFSNMNIFNENNEYSLSDLEFQPLNLSPDLRSYLPNALKIVDYYTPSEDKNNKDGEENNGENSNIENNNENVAEKSNGNDDINSEKSSVNDKIINSWAIGYLEYPLGDIVDYLNLKISTIENKKIKNKFKDEKDTDSSIVDNIKINNLAKDELEKCVIYFLESTPKEKNYNSEIIAENNENNENKEVENNNNNDEPKKDEVQGDEKFQQEQDQEQEQEEEDNSLPYEFHQGYYDINFDDKLIYLRNKFNETLNVLPGFIIGKYIDKYYIIGMNTPSLIKIGINEDNEEAMAGEEKQEEAKQEGQEEKKMDQTEDGEFFHIAIRITKELSKEIYNKIILLNERNSSIDRGNYFNKEIFKIFDEEIKSKEILLKMIKNNCSELYKFINNIKSKNKKLEDLLDIVNEDNRKYVNFSIMLLFNKFCCSSILENKILDLENMEIGYYPGSEIISKIIESRKNLITINLKSNNLYTQGIKEILLPIFNNPKKLSEIGNEIKCLCLDNNKLTDKSLKYLRFLVKYCNNLALLSLSNNNLTGDSLKYLIHSTRGKEDMEILNLNNNLLGENCGENLSSLLSNFGNLSELNLSCNCIMDDSLNLVLNTLKKNKSKLESLFLSFNFLSEKSADTIANFLSNNRYLKILNISNNQLGQQGIKTISQALSTKLVLEEININSINANDEGGIELFENMKLNHSLKRLYATHNNFSNNTMFKFAELLKKTNFENAQNNENEGLEIINFSYNEINDECINYFAEELMNYHSLKEIKFNSNIISSKGAEILLYSVLQNPSIIKLNMENNDTNFNLTSDNFKSYREDIQIYL